MSSTASTSSREKPPETRSASRAARSLVGADLWHWLDPRREVARQGQPPGVDLETLTRIVDRLEHL